MATAISWTDETWNPVTGCSHVSEGCRFCYAERLSLRFGWSAKPWTLQNAPENVKLHPERLRNPYAWKRPSRVFVNSMSDLFHAAIPDAFIAEVFRVMADLPQHTFQVLTKRPERAATWPGPWPGHVWMGTSVEDARSLARVDQLRRCGAAVRFVSAEPLLGSLTSIDLTAIHWLIVGGESGPHLTGPQHPRWLQMAWARELRDACVAAGIAYYFKQDSGQRTEMRPWLVEEDGSRWRYEQYPGDLRSPERVGDDGAYAGRQVRVGQRRSAYRPLPQAATAQGVLI